MKSAISPIHAIWVKVSPYLIEWVTSEFGTGVTMNGKVMLELRTVGKIKNLLRMTVDEDLTLDIDTPNSLSQFRYDVMQNASILSQMPSGADGESTSDILKQFVPVHVPAYMLVSDGTMHPFSRGMQLKQKTALKVAEDIYNAFWNAVHRYIKSLQPIKDTNAIERIVDEWNIPEIYLDGLRNQYQRMKRHHFFDKQD